jgi:hypothetical protein
MESSKIPSNSAARFYPTSVASRCRNLSAHVESSGLNVFFEHVFIGVMADAAGAAEEEHCGGHASGHHHGVVTCAARHAASPAIQQLQLLLRDTLSAARPWELRADPSGVCFRTTSPRRAAMACAWATSRASTAALRAAVVIDMANIKAQACTAPAITLAAFGSTSKWPTVAIEAFGMLRDGFHGGSSTPPHPPAHRGAGASAWCLHGWRGR